MWPESAGVREWEAACHALRAKRFAPSASLVARKAAAHLSLFRQLHVLGKELGNLERGEECGSRDCVSIRARTARLHVVSGSCPAASKPPARLPSDCDRTRPPTGRFSTWHPRSALTISVHRTAVLQSTMRRGVPGSSACFPAEMKFFLVPTAVGREKRRVEELDRGGRRGVHHVPRCSLPLRANAQSCPTLPLCSKASDWRKCSSGQGKRCGVTLGGTSSARGARAR